jgi:hypothetical protein
MNQGPRYVRLMEKSRGKKSRATVPLTYRIVIWLDDYVDLIVRLDDKDSNWMIG